MMGNGNIDYITSQDNVKDISIEKVFSNSKSYEEKLKLAREISKTNEKLEGFFDQFLVEVAKTDPTIIDLYKNNPTAIEEIFNLRLLEYLKNDEIAQEIANTRIELNALDKEITESLYGQIKAFKQKVKEDNSISDEDIKFYVKQWLTYEKVKPYIDLWQSIFMAERLENKQIALLITSKISLEDIKRINIESEKYWFIIDAEIIKKAIVSKVNFQSFEIFDREYKTDTSTIWNTSLRTKFIERNTVINFCDWKLSDISVLKHLVGSSFLHEPQNKKFLDVVVKNIDKVLTEWDQYFFSYLCERLEKNVNQQWLQPWQKNIYKNLLNKLTVVSNKEYLRSRSDVCFLGHCFTAQWYFGPNEDKVNRIARTWRFSRSICEAISSWIKAKDKKITDLLDKSDKFIIDVGINEICRGTDAGTVKKYVCETMKIITDYKRKQKGSPQYTPTFTIFNVTPFSWHWRSTESVNTEAERKKYNTFLKKGIAWDMKFTTIDVASLFEDKNQPWYLASQYDGGDHLHMKAFVYNKYIELIVAKLKSTEKKDNQKLVAERK